MRLELPFPVSVNRIWRSQRGGKGNYRSPEYKAWIKEADAMFLQQKRTCGEPIKGHFNYHISLDWSRRKSTMDGDNYGKIVLDFLQKVELIENDSMADTGTWAWAPVTGCVVQVHRSLIQRAA